MRKSKKVTKRRRRSVGAMITNPNSWAMKLISIGGGFLMADKINPQLDKIPGFTTMDEKTKGGIQGGVGAFFALRNKKADALGMVQTVGGGVLAGAGAKRLLRGMGLISGFQNVPVVGGYKGVPVIGQKRMGAYNTNPAARGLAGYNTNPAARGLANVMGSTGSGSGVTNSDGGDLMG